MSRIYLDSASVAPLRPVARSAMAAALGLPTADPGRLHTEAMEVRAHLEHARDQVAGFLGARSSEVVLNASASEGIATVANGVLGQRRDDEAVIVGTAVEHSAVRLAAGDRFVPVPVTGEGIVEAEALEDVVASLEAEGRDVALVAIQLGNHEMGAVQDLASLLPIAQQRQIPTLVDAAQAAPWMSIDIRSFEPTFLTISGPKLGGPLGSGALVIKRGKRTAPLIVGGSQERGRRAGLENLPAALGLGATCEELSSSLQSEINHVESLTSRLRSGLASLPGVSIFGPGDSHQRLPHLVCCGIEGVEPQAVLIELDRAGIAAHSGSACASEDLEPSPVLAAMGVEAHRSLRLSLHKDSSSDEVGRVLEVLPVILKRLRSL